ncbi:MAG: FAD-dependent oxidoreductase [Pseudomonadota bacterium]
MTAQASWTIPRKFCSGFYGLPPDRINALFYAVATGEYLVHGGQYYKTRSQNLSNTLANHIKKLNGKIKYRTQVEKIIFNDHNQIEGVLDQAGKKYPAQAVIANCSVPTLINQMIDKQQVPDTFKTQINNQKSSLSAVNLWLGLDKKPAGYTSYSTHLSGRAPAMNDFDSSNDMAESSLGIVLYDNLFNGYSMPGKATMSIVCLSDYSPWKQFETDYFNGRKDDYNKEKQRLARRFIQRVESRLIPGLSGMIEEMEMGTPLTNVYYTKNPAGSIYGFDHDKPHLKAETPIKGLYLASAWSHGGGYTPVMMAGRDAAKMVLKKQFV